MREWRRSRISAGLSLGEGRYPEMRLRLHSRNRCLIVLGLYDWTTLIVLGPALLLMDLAWLAFSLLAGRPDAWLRGKAGVLKALPSTLAKRRAFAGRKVLRDRHVLGAPPLTFTGAARRQPLTLALGRILDGVLRYLWHCSRGLLP